MKDEDEINPSLDAVFILHPHSNEANLTNSKIRNPKSEIRRELP